jgi:hypothetical protein
MKRNVLTLNKFKIEIFSFYFKGGNMTLGWAYSNSNNVSVPHDKAGTVVVQLLPPAAPTTAAPTTAAPTTAAPTTAGAGSLSNSIPMALTLLALCWSLV